MNAQKQKCKKTPINLRGKVSEIAMRDTRVRIGTQFYGRLISLFSVRDKIAPSTSIFMTMDIDALRARIVAIANRYRAENIRVFGSTVRSDFEEDSDVDLLVTFGPGASLLDQAGLMDDLKMALGISVDVVSDRALNHYLRDKILAEAQPL